MWYRFCKTTFTARIKPIEQPEQSVVSIFISKWYLYGPPNLDALKTDLVKRGKEGEKVLVRVLNIMQGQRYIEICERNPSPEQFFYGWIANRV